MTSSVWCVYGRLECFSLGVVFGRGLCRGVCAVALHARLNTAVFSSTAPYTIECMCVFGFVFHKQVNDKHLYLEVHDYKPFIMDAQYKIATMN